MPCLGLVQKVNVFNKEVKLSQADVFSVFNGSCQWLPALGVNKDIALDSGKLPAAVHRLLGDILVGDILGLNLCHLVNLQISALRCNLVRHNAWHSVR